MRIGARFIGITLAVAACDAAEVSDGIVLLDPAPEALAGLWTGVEEIGGTAMTGVGGAGDGGIRFPVSLVLRVDRTFTLRTIGFAVSSDTDDRFCEGVFRAEGRVLEFFPDAACRALPVGRFVVGRFFPDGMSLEATTGPAGANPEFGGFDVRVHIVVERSGGIAVPFHAEAQSRGGGGGGFVSWRRVRGCGSEREVGVWHPSHRVERNRDALSRSQRRGVGVKSGRWKRRSPSRRSSMA